MRGRRAVCDPQTVHELAPQPTLRCVIVDDNPSFRSAARLLLEREGIEVVGIAGSIADGRELVSRLRPDLTLVDIDLGGESGFDLVSQLVDGTEPLSEHVILISTHSEGDFADLIEASSADGFLAKAELSVEGIRRILAGG
jgi:two-component system, NarL family, nitrate/nitrite response regulator NarL